MKKLAILLLAGLLILSGCIGGKPEPSMNPAEQSSEIEKNEIEMTGKVRYFLWIGGEDYKNPENVVVPLERFDDLYYKGDGTFPVLLETFRYAHYLCFDEAGNGKYVTVSYEQKKTDGYYEPVFTAEEYSMKLPPDGDVAIVDMNGEKKYYAFHYDEQNRMHIDSEEGFEVFEEVSEERMTALFDGSTGYTALHDAKAGDEVVFGRYEQDICKTNGPDPIVWKVLDVQDGKALLLSKDVILGRPFNGTGDDTNWEYSALRQYLNGTFYREAFTEEERAQIVDAELRNTDENKEYLAGYWKKDGTYIDFNGIADANNGADTVDRVFVLDLGEVRQYLGDEDGYTPIFEHTDTGPQDWLETWGPLGIDLSYGAGGRIASPSEAVIRWSEVGYSTYHQNLARHYAVYWLRTMGDGPSNVLAVTDIGALMPYQADAANVGVRPAVWVRIP